MVTPGKMEAMHPWWHAGDPDFVGRGAVLRQREAEPTWRFAGFVIEGGDADPLPGDPILRDGACVGHVTSGGTASGSANVWPLAT